MRTYKSTKFQQLFSFDLVPISYINEEINDVFSIKDIVPLFENSSEMWKYILFKYMHLQCISDKVIYSEKYPDL